jgi:hypothetical protein
VVTPADPRRCGEVIAWSATTPTPAGSTSSGSSPSCAAGSTACRPRTTPTVPPHGNHAFPSTPPFLDALFTRQATDHLYQTSPASPWTVALAAISPQPGPRPLPVQQLRLPRLPHSLRRPHRRQRQQSWPSRHRRRHHVARRPCWPSIRPPSRERATGRHGGEYPRWAPRPPAGCPSGLGLTTHGLRHGHKTWIADDGIPEILSERRLGYEIPGMRGLYAQAFDRMRAQLTAPLQIRWEDSRRAAKPSAPARRCRSLTDSSARRHRAPPFRP